jgi:hypothetical protein
MLCGEIQCAACHAPFEAWGGGTLCIACHKRTVAPERSVSLGRVFRRSLKRLFCFHHWIKDFPTFSIKGEFAARMGMSTWFCPKCGKEVVRPRQELPLNYYDRAGGL